MDGQLWSQLYRLVRHTARGFKSPKVRHSNATIALVVLWAVLHRRPISWAAQPCHWNTRHRPRRLPDDSTISRRLRQPPVHALLKTLEEALRQRFGLSWCRFIDGKPLPVGGATRDSTATVGRATGRLARGYKLHMVLRADGVPEAWRVTPMHLHEQRVGLRLIQSLPPQTPGYLVADNAYDANKLYRYAAMHQLQLLAPCRPSSKGPGKHPHSPERRAALALAQRPFGQALFKARDTIERYFARLTIGPAGLWSLPPFVRTLRRVRLWVHAAILIDLCQHACRQQRLT